MRRQLGWILVLVIALMSIGAPVAAGSAKVLVVDDDGKASATNCNASTKAYKRIQGAINAASNNTTILVCPGDYFQEIEIVGKRGITLRSVVPWAAKIRTPTGSLGSNPLIGVAAATNTTIKHFRIAPRAGGQCSETLGAVVFLDAPGTSFRGNRVIPTGRKTLTDCPVYYGIVGIGTGDRGVVDYDVRHNIVRDFAGVGIVMIGEVRAVVARNSVQFLHRNADLGPLLRVRNVDARWLSAVRSAAKRFQGAATEDRGQAGWQLGLGPTGDLLLEYGLGILFDEGARGRIQGNNVYSSIVEVGNPVRVRAAFERGVAPTGSGEGVPMEIGIVVGINDGRRVKVARNLVGGAFSGIVVSDATNAIVTRNMLALNFDGISIGYGWGASDLIVKQNLTVANQYGIYVDPDSEDNLFRGNVSYDNSTLDCQDESEGSGTEGTANRWVNNEGETSDPELICGTRRR